MATQAASQAASPLQQQDASDSLAAAHGQRAASATSSGQQAAEAPAAPTQSQISAQEQQQQQQQQQDPDQGQHNEQRHPGRKLLVILHGKRIDDDQVRTAIQRLKAEGHQLVVRVTWDSGDVDQFVREAIEMWDDCKYDTLVAGGGDGTLNELVVALLKHKAPQHVSVAQLPLGTANDLASATGISLDPYEALSLALDPSNVHPIDVALVNGEVFANLATAGPVSGVSSKDMSGTLKKVLGPAAVAVAGLKHLFTTGLAPIPDVRITYPKAADVRHDAYKPDQVGHMHGDLLALAAGQARQMGRMVNLCPDALLDDGLLDFTLLFGSLGSQARELAADLASSGLSDAQGGLQLLRVPWLIVEADEDLKCNRDGEPMEAGDSNRLVFEVLPRRINMHLPDARLLLEGQAEAAAAAAAAAGSQPSSTAAAAAVDPAVKGYHHQQQQQHKGGHHKRGFGWIRQAAMRTGNKRRPALLRDLWRAQQPPGRLSRALPRLQRLLGRAVMAAGLLAVGFVLGQQAQQQWGQGGGGAGSRGVVVQATELDQGLPAKAVLRV